MSTTSTDRFRDYVSPNGNGTKPVDLFGGPPIPLTPPMPPELPDGLLPEWVDNMVSAVAAATETPPVLAGGFALAVLGTAAQGRFVVNPSHDYFEELAMWTATAMVSGSRKTAVMMKMVGPLFKWQQQKAKDFEPEIRQAEADDAIARSRIKKLRETAAKADDATERAMAAKEAQELEDKLQPIPVVPRLTIEDCTPEHTATMMKLQGERLAVISDEGGVLDIWGGRYSNGVANFDVYLKAYSGAPCIVDRGSRPSVYLDRPTLSIGLAPQPAVIGALVNNAAFRQRGLTARFLLFFPESLIGFRTLETTPIPSHVSDEYTRRLIELIELPPAPDDNGGYRPRVLKLTGGAFHVWRDFAREVEEAMRPDGLLDRLQDWGAKLPGAAARIAGLFHVAEHGPEAIRFDEIDAETMTRAVEFARFAIPHARRVFDCLDEDGSYEAARRLWRTCQQHGGDVVTARDLWHPNRGTFKKVEHIEPALRVLIDHNHLAELETAETGRRGRPSRRFRVNPAVIGHSGHRSERERVSV